jgi:carboxymethylenebutenolidase
MTDVQEILKIVLSQKREQTLGDIAAAVDWAQRRPNVKADRVGVTGFCWGARRRSRWRRRTQT